MKTKNEIKEADLTLLLKKADSLIEKAINTTDSAAMDAANDLYFFINEKFYKYAE